MRHANRSTLAPFTTKLHATREANWEGLGHDQIHADMITDAITRSRETISETLMRLK
jgi:hypothetical protein